MITTIPRPEYPRPQFVRKNWVNLNGTWEFEIDKSKSGRDRKWQEREHFDDEILVPFCPESSLSGIGHKDFMNMVWYKKSFTVPEEMKGKRTILHFGAVDYHTVVWINGNRAGEHKGGYTSFSFEITKWLESDENTIVVSAEDDLRTNKQPRGKQSPLYHSFGCEYTRTTGIWQTVWLEFVPENYIKGVKYYPNISSGSVNIEGSLDNAQGCTFKAEAYYQGSLMGECESGIIASRVDTSIQLAEKHLWAPGCPNLYDIKLFLYKDGVLVDEVDSYFGLREVTLHNNAILINHEAVFQRLILDQGFYPDGIYTAPSDEALKRDIEISMELGFNGARLHEKVFEQRFLYWADKMGYLVWGEYANWGLDITNAEGLEIFLPEWLESVERDFNCPALIGWCPFNETWDLNGNRQDNEVLRVVYQVTKALDRTRPCIDTSGNFHVATDIFDIHEYEQDPAKFAEKFEPMKQDENFAFVNWSDRQSYHGEPYFISEYGGIWWSDEEKDGWGYGSRPQSREEFLDRYRSLTETLLSNKRVCAFCYTQLYDVEQEVNGLYTYDRVPKFDPKIIREINVQRAAIEEV